jgi:hypothetical protein
MHPDSTMMYKDLKTRYWWYDMKRDVMEYIALCDTCLSYPGLRRRDQNLYMCAHDVQITCIVTI